MISANRYKFLTLRARQPIFAVNEEKERERARGEIFKHNSDKFYTFTEL